MQHWQKLGQVFAPDGTSDWMHSHASTTVAQVLNDTTVRIYFTCRDAAKRSHIGRLDLALAGDDFEVLEVDSEPVLEPGQAGLFDDSGVTMGALIEHENQHYLYYVGWNLGVTVPWRNFIGLATAQNSGREFAKYDDVPVLDRHHIDPYSVSYPFVLKEADGWKMWYGSNLHWEGGLTGMQHVIRCATSTDGIHWQRHAHICVNVDETDYAFSRPVVLKEYGTYKMWYTYRGAQYRIGYAESADGMTWERKDGAVQLPPSATGWDSEMVCYPYVFDLNHQRYMTYNGNGYGQTGFGLARLQGGTHQTS